MASRYSLNTILFVNGVLEELNAVSLFTEAVATPNDHWKHWFCMNRMFYFFHFWADCCKL